jgi:hypothetical protein
MPCKKNGWPLNVWPFNLCGRKGAESEEDEHGENRNDFEMVRLRGTARQNKRIGRDNYRRIVVGGGNAAGRDQNQNHYHGPSYTQNNYYHR